MFFDETDFTAILKKMTTTIPKNDFFQMWNKIRFLNACCVFWALRIHPNHWQKKNWIHKTTKMKYGPHFWQNMHQNWQNLRKLSWLTLAHGLWWVLRFQNKKKTFGPKYYWPRAWREIAVFPSILATFRLFVKFVAIVMKSSWSQTSKKPKKWVQSELV